MDKFATVACGMQELKPKHGCLIALKKNSVKKLEKRGVGEDLLRSTDLLWMDKSATVAYGMQELKPKYGGLIALKKNSVKRQWTTGVGEDLLKFKPSLSNL